MSFECLLKKYTCIMIKLKLYVLSNIFTYVYNNNNNNNNNTLI